MKLSEKFRKEKFEELQEQQFKIQGLMSLFQNPMEITDEDLMEFENDKNKIINNINKISMDLKLEYDKR